MKIASLKLHPVVTPRRYGTVIAKAGGEARNTVQKSFFFMIELKTDTGLTGWGEVSDIPVDELPESKTEFEDLLSVFTVGRSPYDIQRLHHEFTEHFETGEGALARYTRCALDAAFYDIQGQAAGRPVSDLIGGAVRRKIDISWVAYIREEEELLAAEIEEKVAQGFHAFKLKVGVDIELDERRVALTREIAGRSVSIKVDANEGWSVEDAPKNIERLNQYRLDGVETPVPRENPEDIAAVRKQSEVPILEHVSTADFGLALIQAGAVDVFNISVPGCGGIWPARQIVSLAEGAGLGILIGSTVEMGPGTLGQLHLASTVRNLVLPSDLIGPGMYVDDVLKARLAYVEGQLDVPARPGLGCDVDPAKLRRLAF